MNVAIRSQSLGINARIISKIGDDKPGREINSFLTEKQVDTSLLQLDYQLATGSVDVNLDENGIVACDGFKVELADTVGSGDSFLASLIFMLLTSKDFQENNKYACAVGALVASETGANPIIANEKIH